MTANVSPKNRRQMDRRLVTILLIVFVQMLGASMLLPILPTYARAEFGMSEQSITLLLSAFFAAQFVAGPWIGRLSDRYGRIPVLIISQVGTAVSFAMIGLAWSVPMLFFARILDGITGGNIIVAQAYITDITPKEKRTEALGYVFAVFGLGFIFGPAIGGILNAAFGPSIPFFIASIAAFAVVIMTWFTLDETLTPEQRAANRAKGNQNFRASQLIRNKVLVTILLTVFVTQFGLGMLQATFALYGEDVIFAGYSQQAIAIGIGFLLSVVGISQVMTQTVVLPRLLKRMADPLVVLLGSISRALGGGLFAVAVNPFIGAVAAVFFALGMGLMMPPLQSLSTQVVDDEARGGVLGLYQSSVSLSTIFSTALAGSLYTLDPSFPYWLSFALSLLVVGLMGYLSWGGQLGKK
jgi:MFS transporter, DHA1 family, tetracycline resistance protein